MAKMSDAELIAMIEREETASYGYLTGELGDERQKALRWYLGEKTDELEPVEGRTSVVDTVIADAVETILPSLVKTFCAGEEVVEFRPVGPDDVDSAEQETAYINHIVQTKSNWLETFYSWAKDALIQKVGYVRAWHESNEDIREEEYEGLGNRRRGAGRERDRRNQGQAAPNLRLRQDRACPARGRAGEHQAPIHHDAGCAVRAD